MSIAASKGVYRNTQLQSVHWGNGVLSSALPTAVEALGARKALVLTGRSLATKTDVIKQVEKVLGGSFGATFYEIGEHAPIAGIRKAVEVMRSVGADVIVSVGGGSPIDAAKAIAHIVHEGRGGEYVPSIAVPTTLSVAETTQNASFKSEEGHKIGVSHPALVPRHIIYDASLSVHTPERLWLSTGVRALDHAVEFLYRFDTHPVLRDQALGAVRNLFTLLPMCKRDPADVDVRQRLQLACLSSLWPEARSGALGLSHGIGHKLGATYGIGHGITSCLALAESVKLTARAQDTPVEQLAALADALAYIPAPYNPNPAPLGPGVGSVKDVDLTAARKAGEEVGNAIQRLVDDLGLHSTLKDCGVPEADIDVIANRVVGEDKKDTPKWKEVQSLLQSIYE